MTALPRDRPAIVLPVGDYVRGNAENFRDRLIATQSVDEFAFHASLSQIVTNDASGFCHRLSVEAILPGAHSREMDDQTKNGGPNHLRAWRTFRNMTQEQLAKAIGTAPNVIQYLETGERGLSAKWLRKLAPALNTTPGLLLDHDPHELPTDIMEIWSSADAREKRQISDIARAIIRTGTEG